MLALLFLLFVFVGLGFVSIFVSLPLINEKVKPNPFYGFRVRATLKDPKVWYAANKYFGQRLLLAGVVEIFAAIALFAVPNVSVEGYVSGVLGIFVIAFTVGMIQSFNYLKSIRRESNDSADPHI